MVFPIFETVFIDGGVTVRLAFQLFVIIAGWEFVKKGVRMYFNGVKNKK